MRVRQYPVDIKESEIRERYREKETAFLEGPNSEKVWQERATVREEFMQRDPDEVEGVWAKLRWKEV
jgi:hypothetical protein